MKPFSSDSFNVSSQDPLNISSPPFPDFTDSDEEILTDCPILCYEDDEENNRATPNCNGEAETQFNNEADNEPHPTVKRKELSDEERVVAYSMLLQRSFNGKLNKTAMQEVALLFNVSMRSIQRLWRRGKESGKHNVLKRKVQNCGRKRVQLDLERVKEIPLRKRTTLRCLAHALGMSKTFLVTKMKSNELRRHSNYIHPTLTDRNRFARIEHCLSMIDPATVPTTHTFLQMETVVHIDEKWFSMTKKIQKYYLTQDEEEPVRDCKSTNFIPKIMFMAAVARPRYDSEGICTFDGKLGVFPMVFETHAVRSSVNREAGSLEVKSIPRISRDVIRTFMISKILPAIKDKWPRDSLTMPILIQQDNAKTHINEDDVDFLLAVRNLGLNVKIICQPPNSPDLNVLDLGFFRAIQSLQEKECATSVVQLIAAVEKSFYQFSTEKSNNIFITLQSCMIEILSSLGSNTYKIPHLSKNQLQRLGILPARLQCNSSVIDAAIGHLPQ